MTFSEKEVRLFVKLKQSLWFDRYKLVVSLVLLFLSIVLHVFGNQFELVFSIIAFLILIEACLSKKVKRLLRFTRKRFHQMPMVLNCSQKQLNLYHSARC